MRFAQFIMAFIVAAAGFQTIVSAQEKPSPNHVHYKESAPDVTGFANRAGWRRGCRSSAHMSFQ